MDQEIKRQQEARAAAQQQSKQFLSSLSFDQDIYSTKDDNFETTVVQEEEEEDILYGGLENKYTHQQALKEVLSLDGETDTDPLQGRINAKRIAEKEGSYKARRLARPLSPERGDAFAQGRSAERSGEARSYSEVMREVEYEKDRDRTMKKIQEIQADQARAAMAEIQQTQQNPAEEKRKRRWDAQPEPPKQSSEWEEEESKTKSMDRKKSRWDETPASDKASTAWDATPKRADGGATPARRSRWDETPVGKTGTFFYHLISQRRCNSRWKQRHGHTFSWISYTRTRCSYRKRNGLQKQISL